MRSNHLKNKLNEMGLVIFLLDVEFLHSRISFIKEENMESNLFGGLK